MFYNCIKMFAKSFDCIKLFIHGCILTAILYFMKIRTNRAMCFVFCRLYPLSCLVLSCGPIIVLRVPGFLPGRPNWVPHILTRKRVLTPPPFGSMGGAILACGGGGGGEGTNSDEGTDTLVL